ncbi:FecR family protein [Pseudomonas sp. UBA1879]|uniref:FecR family protein n=1 Tax=Pseudomonas sp. UBA1879 TaxID=1947305 RepID=UPI002600BD3C|nr:FecR domain-containing protein [Pseudomonas sp. UBA1879]
MTDSHSPGPVTDSALDQALNWLIALETADAQQRARFQDWLAADPAHGEAFAKAEAVWHSQPILEAALALATPEKPSALRRLRAHWLPLATAAVVLLGLFNFSDVPLRLKADHLTVAGERQRLELGDGSKVLLNTRSAFSSGLDDRQRVARLYEGEAFFEVPTAKGLPLEVEAGPVRMSASSTAFAVRYLDGVAQIQVERGALNVQATRGNSHISLNAGDSLRVGPEGFGHREKVDQNKDLAWIQGRLIFDNCPLKEVLAELRRYYPGWIVNANTQLDQVTVTGNYRLDNPIDVVRSLAHITSAQLHELPAVVILN